MTRLALIGTIGAVVVAAILGLIYAVGKQDVDDTPATTQSQPANSQNQAQNPAAQTPATGNGAAPATQGNQAQQNQSQANQAAPAPANAAPGTQNGGAQNSAASNPPAAQSSTSQSSTSQGTTSQAQAPQAEAPASQPPASTSNAASGAASTQTASVANPPAGSAAPEVKPSFDVVRVNPNGDAVIAGRSEPGAKITLLDGGKPIGSAEADDRGEWVMLPDSAIDPGEHKFSLKATDDKGTSLESDKEVIVVVPKPAEDIAGRPVTRPSGALAIEVPKQGTAPTQLLNSPDQSGQPSAPVTASAAGTAPAQTPPPPLSLDTIDYTQDGRAMLSGHSLPNGDLLIYLDNNSIGNAKGDDSGRWTFVPETKAPTGPHELRVDMVDGNGKVIARVKVPFSQPDFSTVAVKDGSVIVQPGNSLWRLARRTYGNGVMFTIIYEANKGQISDPNLIYPGQIFQLPAKKN